MKISSIGIGFISAALLCGLASAVETDYAAGTKALPLQQAGGTARAMAMGSAVVAVDQGSASLLWNPAGLSRMCCKEIGFHHNWARGHHAGDLVFGMPLERSKRGGWFRWRHRCLPGMSTMEAIGTMPRLRPGTIIPAIIPLVCWGGVDPERFRRRRAERQCSLSPVGTTIPIPRTWACYGPSVTSFPTRVELIPTSSLPETSVVPWLRACARSGLTVDKQGCSPPRASWKIRL